MKVIDFGLKNYAETLELQQSLFTALLEEKKGNKESRKDNKKESREYVLIGEQNPVITKGRRAKDENILIPEELLKQQGISIFQTGRGGDVTFHGPGQMIVYPIIDLERHRLGVKDYVWLLEESVILLLREYGIKGERIEGATGVWLGRGSDNERKISAIGIKCSRYCTMHGLSLNVDMDLRGFSIINPCGFKNKGVTTMAYELKKREHFEEVPSIEEVKQKFLHIFFSLIFPFEEVFNFPEQLRGKNEII